MISYHWNVLTKSHCFISCLALYSSYKINLPKKTRMKALSVICLYITWLFLVAKGTSPVHLTGVNLRTDSFSVVLWGFLLRFGRNGVNFNIKITSSYGNGFDRTFNFTFLTPRHSAELILLTNLSIKLSFHSN